MSECNGTCSEHNGLMNMVYEVKAGNKYILEGQKDMKNSIERIEDVLNKYITTSDDRMKKIATDVATTIMAKDNLDERKFSWQRITWTVALIVSIAGNVMAFYK